VRILGICGSLQARSSNLTLLHVAQEAAANLPGVELVLFDGLRDLPLFNPDLEAEAPLPVVEAWRRAIAGSDALFIACPEYGFSLPGALKNAIDWVIGTGELERKLIAVTAATPGIERGRRGLASLREPLTAVSARVVGGEPIARGPGFEGGVAALVRALVEASRAPE
jgi:NAD(P)H-dependent FMN reductase